MAEATLCAGWLTKLGYKSGKWQSRYFAMERGALNYYTTLGGKLKGSIPLSTMVGVQYVGEYEPVDPTACTTQPKKPVCDFAFKVEAMLPAGPRAYYFIATSEAERETWVSQLHATITGKPITSQQRQQQQQQQQYHASPQRGAGAGGAGGSNTVRTFVPRSPKTQQLNILRQPWFRRAATAQDIREYLRPAQAGAFVIKDTPGKHGDFDLWMQTGERVCKLLIQRMDHEGTKCWGVPGTGIAFEHLLDFVFHYCRKPFRIKQLPQGELLLNLSACSNAEKMWRTRRGTVSRPAVRPQRKQQRRAQRPQAQQQASPQQSASSTPAVDLNAAQDRLSNVVAELSVLSQQYASKKQKLDDLNVSVEISQSSLDMRLQGAQDSYNALVSRVADLEQREELRPTLAALKEDISSMTEAASTDKEDLAAKQQQLASVVEHMEAELHTLERSVQSTNGCLQTNQEQPQRGQSQADVAAALTETEDALAAAQSRFQTLNAELTQHLLEMTDVLGRNHSVDEQLRAAEAAVAAGERAQGTAQGKGQQGQQEDGEEAEGASQATTTQAEAGEEEEAEQATLVAVDEDVFDALDAVSSDDDDDDDDDGEMGEEQQEVENRAEKQDGLEEGPAEDKGQQKVFEPDAQEAAATATKLEAHDQKAVDEKKYEQDAKDEEEASPQDAGAEEKREKQADENPPAADNDKDKSPRAETTTTTTAAADTSPSSVSPAKKSVPVPKPKSKSKGGANPSSSTPEKKQAVPPPTKPKSGLKPRGTTPTASPGGPHWSNSNNNSSNSSNARTDTAPPDGDMSAQSSAEDDSEDDDVVDLVGAVHTIAGEHSQRADNDAAKREERQRSKALQRKTEQEAWEARAFVEGVLGEKVEGSLAQALRSGVLLCKVMNALVPNSIKHISTSKMSFHQMENIGYFLSTIEGYGIRSSDSFQTVDLFEEQNIPQVVRTLLHLKRIAVQRGHATDTGAGDESEKGDDDTETEKNAKQGMGEDEKEEDKQEERSDDERTQQKQSKEEVASDAVPAAVATPPPSSVEHEPHRQAPGTGAPAAVTAEARPAASLVVGDKAGEENERRTADEKKSETKEAEQRQHSQQEQRNKDVTPATAPADGTDRDNSNDTAPPEDQKGPTAPKSEGSFPGRTLSMGAKSLPVPAKYRK